MADYQVGLLGLAPYDPKKNKPKDVGLGGPSTEYLMTDMHPQGGSFNYPSIWWDAQGNPVLLPPDEAYNKALEYEKQTGQRFPYYPQDTLQSLMAGPDESKAIRDAINRSKSGGAENTPLMGLLGTF